MLSLPDYYCVYAIFAVVVVDVDKVLDQKKRPLADILFHLLQSNLDPGKRARNKKEQSTSS